MQKAAKQLGFNLITSTVGSEQLYPRHRRKFQPKQGPGFHGTPGTWRYSHGQRPRFRQSKHCRKGDKDATIFG